MTKQEEFYAILKIAELHANRLSYALRELTKRTPITAETIVNLSNSDLGVFELYSSRFAKLQDLMGSKIFPFILEYGEENIEELSFIDRLLKLEKLGVLDDVNHWLTLRQIRNILTHEYPDKPEITAKSFNEALSMGPYLILCLNKAKDFFEKINEMRKKL